MIVALLLLAQEELTASGVFTKVGKAWTVEKDVEIQEMKENYVEREFQAVAGVKLYAWARVGACCKETFAAYYQASDATIDYKGKKTPIGPGDVMAAPLKAPSSSMPKEHKGHGEKRPERWIWMEIPLPDFPSSGAKRVRLLTDQKGFSVERIHVGKEPKPPAD